MGLFNIWIVDKENIFKFMFEIENNEKMYVWYVLCRYVAMCSLFKLEAQVSLYRSPNINKSS
jgi:hypothetical protein